MSRLAPARMNSLEQAIVRATQAGLPLVPRPFKAVAEAVGATEEAVIACMKAMQADGRIRRIAAVPNHYALGYRANAMTVWDVADDAVDALGRQVGALEFVSHCYRRPRRLPHWRYNLLAMVHGRDRQETADRISIISTLLGSSAQASEVLYSTRILKKTGLRIA
ncbi:MAG TPA: Lrp/AsnC family transcriptional regulator [Burkholderiales bacterium]|nr:Lrp/AsnC family transcriptional regulator [Burkholderiales bacterium]